MHKQIFISMQKANVQLICCICIWARCNKCFRLVEHEQKKNDQVLVHLYRTTQHRVQLVLHLLAFCFDLRNKKKENQTKELHTKYSNAHTSSIT